MAGGKIKQIVNCTINPSDCNSEGDSIGNISVNDISRDIDDVLQEVKEHPEIGIPAQVLIDRIEEAKTLWHNITHPQEMVRIWVYEMLGKGEDAAIAYLEEKTQPFENENFELVSIVMFSLRDTTIYVLINIFILMPPGQDTTEFVKLRQRSIIYDMSQAVIYAEFNFDISRAVEPGYMKDVFLHANVGIRLINEESTELRSFVSSQIQQQKDELLLNLIEGQFSEYFAFYKQIQDITSAFSFR
ncbi:hypothetical protein FC697_21760 [Bacillus wiedmannii]|uniref:hypothetical protein n=1 Tax=Bacillus wiedmannii TaxID=1890302 RepID=UPI0010BE17ED|nr:hypothetical protein [Bacillus wiedmannii]TKH17825.1 hypothetical protein FC697_21760 [Bacillus wiedmannii]